jgi:hypothetical protein
MGIKKKLLLLCTMYRNYTHSCKRYDLTLLTGTAGALIFTKHSCVLEQAGHNGKVKQDA